MRFHTTGRWTALIGVAMLGFVLPASAIDSMSFEAGAGSRVEMVRVGAQWDWQSRWFQSNGSHVGGYWDLSVAQWRGTRYQGIPGQHQNITSVGLTPTLRWQRDDKQGWYAEVGIGANLLSKLYDNNGNRLSTRFQFGDHIALGYVFNKNLDIALKVHHYSNAQIKQPNDGADFVGLRVKHKF